MPFLKPFTAPPRSSPMLRIFLVPNTNATMTRTISQCQMLKLPMIRSPLGGRCRAFLPGARAPDNMKMQVGNFLTAFCTCVDDHPEAAFRTRRTAVFVCQPWRQGHHSTQPFGVFCLDVLHRYDMAFGDK